MLFSRYGIGAGDMRILAISDAHYPSEHYAAWFLTMLLNHVDFDALVLAGDFIDASIEAYAERLAEMIRRAYNGPVLVVWGNHEHYLSKNKIRKGVDSISQLRRLRETLKSYGFRVLDAEAPIALGSLSIVGVVGWYDFSYGPRQYNFEDYERCNPFGLSPREIEDCIRGRLPYPCTASWWRGDCLYVRLPMSHQEYAWLNAERLGKQLARADPPILVVLHHAPWRSLLRYTGNPDEDFDLAYAGAELLGKALSPYSEQLIAVVYGHLHNRSRDRIQWINGVPYINAYHGGRRPVFTVIKVEGRRLSSISLLHASSKHKAEEVPVQMTS